MTLVLRLGQPNQLVNVALATLQNTMSIHSGTVDATRYEAQGTPHGSTHSRLNKLVGTSPGASPVIYTQVRVSIPCCHLVQSAEINMHTHGE